MKETRVELHFYYNREAGFIYKMNKKKASWGLVHRSDPKARVVPSKKREGAMN